MAGLLPLTTEQVELASLRGDIEELRAILAQQPALAAEVEARFARNRPIRDKSSVGWAKRVLQMAGGGTDTRRRHYQERRIQ